MAKKTKAEIKDLIHQWEYDPCWDLYETEGFEEHREELERYQKSKEMEWHLAHQDKIKMRASKLNCTFETAAYIEALEYRLSRMQQMIDKIYCPS